MTDGRIRAANTIARETIDILQGLVTNNGTDRAGAATTAACVTLLLTGLAGRNPTGAEGTAQPSDNGLQFASAVLELLREDVPVDLQVGDGLRPKLPTYIPLEAEGHIMYGLTRLRSAIQNWTMLPGVDGADLIQAGFAGGIRQFVKDNRAARPIVAYELVAAIGRLIERPVPARTLPRADPAALFAPPADPYRGYPVHLSRTPFSHQAAAA
ncbi:hypothetical protein BHAOGJBA_4515 [Methylobacterium hispanicum]|uniref:Uncharacterized protein n=1 Tax=Methylobacterium hispanicum TaxID=270350 RepID=A0AAV4ZT29_9HYPH|nr:hypothetical protein [Methylobacterium hispanicum]GJD90971.1 hypothetical protein BHAOGJBA_4515 [Methylobacterium hispanicum]